MTDDTAAQAGREPIDRSDESLAYGDASARLVAYLIDGVLVGIAIFVVAFVISRFLGPTRVVGADGLRPVFDQGRALVNAVMATTLSGVYFVGCWLGFRATVGQRLLGIVVVRESDSERLRPGQALVRWVLLGAWWGVLGALLLSISLAAWVLALAIVVWDLVLLWTTAYDDRKRGLHDRAAGSVVHRRVRLVSAEA
jgi:uncharacterized RDD family membrane protein YckC